MSTKQKSNSSLKHRSSELEKNCEQFFRHEALTNIRKLLNLDGNYFVQFNAKSRGELQMTLR